MSTERHPLGRSCRDALPLALLMIPVLLAKALLRRVKAGAR